MAKIFVMAFLTAALVQLALIPSSTLAQSFTPDASQVAADTTSAPTNNVNGSAYWEWDDYDHGPRPPRPPHAPGPWYGGMGWW